MTHTAPVPLLVFEEWIFKIGPELTAVTGQVVLLITVTGLVVYACYRVYARHKVSGYRKPHSKESDTDDSRRQSDESPIQLQNPAFPPGCGPNEPERQKQHATAQNTGTNQPAPHDNASTEDSNVIGGEMEFAWQTGTGVSFDDIGGMDDLKGKLRAEIIQPMENPEKAEELGVAAPNVIFHGPPGTGKTFTAEALATELGLPFAKLSGADVQSKWINESASTVNDLFSEAEEMAAREGGAVVFLDELDSVLKNRTGSGSSHEEDNKVVNEFLNHLEDTKDHGIIFIGATNRVDSLDDAGVRSGRIDLKIEVGKPDVEAREAILRAQLNDREHNVSDAYLKELAAETEGVVAADLELIVNNAAKQVLARGGSTISRHDITRALRSM